MGKYYIYDNVIDVINAYLGRNGDYMEKNLTNNLLRIAGVVKESTVDGPGFRYTVFTQGCPHKCFGCHNPQTHDFSGGKLVDIDSLAEDINKNPLLKGVTISGGEPFMQAKCVTNLLSKINPKLTVMVYTGFEYETLLKKANDDNCYMDLLKHTDVLIDGRFVMELKDENIPFRGSKNQRAIDVKKSFETNSIVEHEFYVDDRRELCTV